VAHIGQLFVPSANLGYGGETLSAVRETIEQKEFSKVDEQITRIAAAIERQVALLKSATAQLNGQ
jgi:hypothetical protein